jgi:signal transduction histidine kinase
VGEHKLLEIINALVSHEMRNPLNAISAMIGRIKEQYSSIV